MLKKALFGQNGSQNGPIRGRKRPAPGYFCRNVTPIPSRRDGRRFGADPVTIPENHIFARVASGGLLQVKVGPEPGFGDAWGLTRKSARIEFFLWSLLLNKSARAKPLAAIWSVAKNWRNQPAPTLRPSGFAGARPGRGAHKQFNDIVLMS